MFSGDVAMKGPWEIRRAVDVRTGRGGECPKTSSHDHVGCSDACWRTRSPETYNVTFLGSQHNFLAAVEFLFCSDASVSLLLKLT